MIGSELPSTDYTTPYLPTGFSYVEGDLDTGLVIQDSSGNQYVWVEVPRTTTVYATTGLSITEFTDDEYTSIENDLHTYTNTYRTTHTDTYSSEEATGLTSDEYYELKNKMLKSVYKNGGFYVGKYEAGIEDSYRDYETDLTTEHAISQTAVIQANAYPYNWVRCSQAQSLASSMQSGEYTSSLMFGVQWNLVLKYLETKGVSVADLNSDSKAWGNCMDSEYSITNTSAKYSALDLDTSLFATYADAPYSKESGEITILTTGASSTFSKQGIYDLAGNMLEWTLASSSDSSEPCSARGGDCASEGFQASSYDGVDATLSFTIYGFRPSIF